MQLFLKSQFIRVLILHDVQLKCFDSVIKSGEKDKRDLKIFILQDKHSLLRDPGRIDMCVCISNICVQRLQKT